MPYSQDHSVLEQLDMRIITAKNFKTGEIVEVLVDGDFDGDYLAEFCWGQLPNGYIAKYNNREYITDRTGTIVGVTEHFEYLHHLVLPKKKGFWIKHINGNLLDNRSVNLRYMTPSESALTRPQSRRKARVGSGYRGVYRDRYSKNGSIKYYNSFRPKINGEYHGVYPTAEEAAKEYDRLAYEKWGDRAILNFPKEEK